MADTSLPRSSSVEPDSPDRAGRLGPTRITIGGRARLLQVFQAIVVFQAINSFFLIPEASDNRSDPVLFVVFASMVGALMWWGYALHRSGYEITGRALYRHTSVLGRRRQMFALDDIVTLDGIVDFVRFGTTRILVIKFRDAHADRADHGSPAEALGTKKILGTMYGQKLAPFALELERVSGTTIGTPQAGPPT